jgi:NADH-quinone oxidoreductase subunit J
VEQALFLTLAAGATFGAANVVLRRNPAICAVFLVVTFVCISGLYLLLGFPFLAALQLMIYAGAIMVLFLFVVMLLNLEKEVPRQVPYASIMAPLVCACLVGVVGPFVLSNDVRLSAGPESEAPRVITMSARDGAEGGAALSEALFGKFLLPFEATSLLILAALIAVVVLAKKRGGPVRAVAGSGAATSHPARRQPGRESTRQLVGSPAVTGAEEEELP